MNLSNFEQLGSNLFTDTWYTGTDPLCLSIWYVEAFLEKSSPIVIWIDVLLSFCWKFYHFDSNLCRTSKWISHMKTDKKPILRINLKVWFIRHYIKLQAQGISMTPRHLFFKAIVFLARHWLQGSLRSIGQRSFDNVRTSPCPTFNTQRGGTSDKTHFISQATSKHRSK